jgi:hypothetical protein
VSIARDRTRADLRLAVNDVRHDVAIPRATSTRSDLVE